MGKKVYRNMLKDKIIEMGEYLDGAIVIIIVTMGVEKCSLHNKLSF